MRNKYLCVLSLTIFTGAMVFMASLFHPPYDLFAVLIFVGDGIIFAIQAPFRS